MSITTIQNRLLEETTKYNEAVDPKLVLTVDLLQEYGLTYIYYSFDISSKPGTYNWIDVNTKHMTFVLREYARKCKDFTYSMIIRINKETKYVSKDVNSIVSYFREHRDDITGNDLYKKINIEFNFEIFDTLSVL